MKRLRVLDVTQMSYPQVTGYPNGVSEGIRTPDIQDHNLAL
jgi:hypothetical protein